MMSAWSETGQPSKKKLPTYGKGASKSRAQNAVTAKTTQESPQPAASAPAKDIYDYDFVDDGPAPPVAKAEARPKPKPLSGARGTTKSTSTGSSSLSAMAASLALKNAPSPQRTQARATGEPSRGIKRKPSYFETSAGRPAAVTTTSTNTSTSASSKEQQRPSASADRSTGLAPAAPLFKNIRPPGKPSAANPSPFAGSPSRIAKTPPRDRSAMKTPVATSTRAPSTSPGKGRSPAAAAALANSRKTPLGRPAQQVPFRPVTGQPAPPQSQQRRQEPIKQPQLATPSTAQRKRRRLIDTLVAQKEEEEESSDEEDTPRANETRDAEASSQGTASSKCQYPPSSPASDGRGTLMELDSLATLSPGRASVAPSTPATVSRRVATRRPGVKFTYNLERTMLAEEPVVMGGSSGGSDLSLLQSLLPEPESQSSAFDFDDDMGGSQGAIQSIHELRQAGANSRYADELVDILDRVGKPSEGKPSSTRRSALLEMVQKLQEKSFLRHFRDQGSDTQLYRDVGKETDTISGFALICIAVTLLTNAPSNRLFRELRQQKINDLFALLLQSETDIVTLSKDRKSNVSNFGRQTLASIKGTVQKLAIWKPAPTSPTHLSPRTMALKALHMYAQQTQAASDKDESVLSKALTKQLFDIVQSELPSAYDKVDDSSPSQSLLATGLSDDAESVDLYLALSLLEMHSVAAMQSDIGAEWTRHYIPIITDALESSLKEHQSNKRRMNDLELLVLKLALNTANNNPEAARYYVDKGLLKRLAELCCTSLGSVVHSVKTGENFAPEALEELLLMLGVMINFSENDATAGETLVEGSSPRLFDRLGKFFLDGAAVTADADSEEKSQLNVAFAYLSILLGYLCLHEPMYEAFKELSPSGSLRPLLESINQFIAFHDQLGKTNEADNGAEMSHFTARLRALAHELEVRAY